MIALGLDLGDRHIGVAITDLETRVVRPLTTLPNNRAFVNELAKLQHQHNFSVIVVGWPIHLTGQLSVQTKHVEAMVEKIRRHLPDIEIIFEDERLSSKFAATRLRGVERRKGDVHTVSAQVILEHWLTRQPKP